MPLKKGSCDECHTKHNECPQCGYNHVTPRDNMNQKTPNEIVDYGGEEKIVYHHVCWGCDWNETVTVTIERERTP